ncbi:hypothetical protein BTH42_31685 [Burkholderia sp. SRS-W-2-2016]|uniref:hypothetical protein n=1 Tax=Burkholderia sp. SRS-W-2-2016 TaxID=1926878 RepID=UPI00094B585A|nr:hypothetical protein [Burkholderia sp. SRS-W-2-2016]OLL27766.1 hypothetical protein BTH42_31685 [Burkholderia sp. SRS-W-2-2016]
MELIDRMVPYYRKFMALPFFARRAIIFVASVALWWFAAMLASRHTVDMDLCAMLLLTSMAGVVWSSEIWRLWKVFAIVVVVCLAILKS